MDLWTCVSSSRSVVFMTSNLGRYVDKWLCSSDRDETWLSRINDTFSSRLSVSIVTRLLDHTRLRGKARSRFSDFVQIDNAYMRNTSRPRGITSQIC